MISIADTHPELEDFINIKTENGSITKANISVRISDKFMRAVETDGKWKLHWEGEDGQVIDKTVKAREIFRRNAENNWDWAEAGMLFWDRIKTWHLMSEHPEHEFAGVNPCAEEPLMAGGSCLLGSLNLSEFIVHPFTPMAYFDYTKFADAVRIAVEGLNEVLDEGLPLHPLGIQKDNARDWRQIGLGIMGLADALVKLGIPYGSTESIEISDKIADTMKNYAIFESSELAKRDGAFPMYNEDAISKSPYFQELWEETKDRVLENGLRNSQILTIAPTGSISTMWGISGGIEPIFATHFDRRTESLHGEDVTYKVYTPIVKEYLDFHSIDGNLSVAPKDLFVTSHTVPWYKRIRIQSTWQNHIDASISSTVNLPESATVTDVENLFSTAWEMGLKGVTIFRDGCKRAGILTLSSDDPEIESEPENTYTEDGKMICPECGSPIEVMTNGCSICMECGHSPC